MPSVSPADLSVGAFSADPPWLVDLDALTWRVGAAARRAATQAQVPELLKPRRLPPGSRVIRVAIQLGRALAGWYLLDRRRGRFPRHRAGVQQTTADDGNAANDIAPLENQDFLAGFGEICGGDQAVMAGADDDGVVLAHDFVIPDGSLTMSKF